MTSHPDLPFTRSDVDAHHKRCNNLRTPAYSHTALRDWFFWLIGSVVFASRWLTMSRPYFADGPRLINAAKTHAYVIQPPGYWLYARLAALFPDPGSGLSIANVVLSSLGVMTFYLLCLHLTSRVLARLATASYASVYFCWFAGSTQSSYAGELLFSPLMLLFMLQYVDTGSLRHLLGVAISYALIGGVRPSDGAFLAPLFIYFVLHHIHNVKYRFVTFFLVLVLCLTWYIPQEIALSHVSNNTNSTQLWSVAGNSAPILHPFSTLAASTIARVVLPLIIAFWSLLPAITLGFRQNHMRQILWIWLLPGILFFTLIFFADATYLCFLVPAIVLLAVSARPNALTHVGFALCFASNVLFFLLARPINETRLLPLAVYSVTGPRYCAWALKHQWYRTLDTYTDIPAIKSRKAINSMR